MYVEFSILNSNGIKSILNPRLVLFEISFYYLVAFNSSFCFINFSGFLFSFATTRSPCLWEICFVFPAALSSKYFRRLARHSRLKFMELVCELFPPHLPHGCHSLWSWLKAALKSTEWADLNVDSDVGADLHGGLGIWSDTLIDYPWTNSRLNPLMRLEIHAIPNEMRVFASMWLQQSAVEWLKAISIHLIVSTLAFKIANYRFKLLNHLL